MRTSLRIWDLPTRLFHWALVVCVIGAFVTVKLGGLYMDWHVRFGIATVGLIAFRLAWGLIGPRYARFSQFVRGPSAIAGYLRGTVRSAGHNPLGALSALVMLLAIGFQAISGLFVSDDIMIQGPLYGRISEDTSATLTGLHKANEWVLITLVALHLLAVIWYSAIKRQRLVQAMITGDKPLAEVPADALPAQDGPAVWLRAVVLAACCTGLVYWILSLEVLPAF